MNFCTEGADFTIPQRPPDVVDEIVLTDGTRTPLRVFVADSAAPNPLVVLFPGLGTPASYFDLFATRCSAAGVSVACADLRGQGASRPRPSRASVFGQQEMVVDDVPSAIAVARRHVPDGPLYLAGHSMGGHITSLYAARQAHRAAEGGRRLGTDDSHRLSGLILIASGVPFHKLYRGGSGLRASLGPLAMYRISHAVGFWPGTVVEGYGRQSRVLIRDWTYLNRHGRFSPRGADIDYEAAFGEIDIPVLAVTIGADSDAPPPVMGALTAKFTRGAVDHRHIGAPLGHNRWARDAVAPRLVVEWLSEL
ncbi:alpha/beta fold hydrolase [Gordonia sp. 852002-10350_SCH5691597]|uniref:alpha/beta fold hydrolase n=1 Tax=Gordonia sp. 852002-10350_SCH5691597 TaxID=1834085 RepID=UPI000ADB4678|nr:alpha/beta fold hydrolase [Gordonia sp. 852002-10350_SCH5691597]